VVEVKPAFGSFFGETNHCSHSRWPWYPRCCFLSGGEVSRRNPLPNWPLLLTAPGGGEEK
jgi:hypothetical protein